MKVLIVLMSVMVCVCVAAPHISKEHHILRNITSNEHHRMWSAVSNLAVEIENVIVKRIKENENTTGHFNVMTIVHLLGYSDHDILNKLHNLEDDTAKLMPKLTEDEKHKLENAGVDLVMMLRKNNFNLDNAVSDITTIKSVFYQHLSKDNQVTLDQIEQVITKFLKVFGYL